MRGKTNIRLSIIVPAYKEEKIIETALERIVNTLAQIRYPSEVIVVIDGNVDRTLKEALKVARKHKNVKVIAYEKNLGKGQAVKIGFAHSRGDIVGFIDAGMEIDPNGLSMCLLHLEWYDADIIVGSKRHPASKISYPPHRKILSFGYQTLVWLLFGLKIRDSQVGLKLFRREVLSKVFPRIIVKKYAFDIEVLAVAVHLGYDKIFEAPVQMKFRQERPSEILSPKMRSMIFSMLVDTLAVFYRLRILKYYDYQNRGLWHKFSQNEPLLKTSY